MTPLHFLKVCRSTLVLDLILRLASGVERQFLGRYDLERPRARVSAWAPGWTLPRA
jgi:hypothetical protein